MYWIEKDYKKKKKRRWYQNIPPSRPFNFYPRHFFFNIGERKVIFRITKFFIILGDIIKQSLLDILESFEIKKLNCSFVLYPLYTKKTS